MPKLINHALRRGEILEATWSIIAADGIHGATVRHVAERAGLDPGSVRYIFRTQDELLLAAAHELRTRVEAGIARRADDYSRPDQAISRLAAALPGDSERQLQWRVERAFLLTAHKFPTVAHTVHTFRPARLDEVEVAISAMAFGLDVSAQTIDFEVKRAYALSEGLGSLVSDKAMSSATARQTLIMHLRGAQENWKLAQAAKARGAARARAAQERTAT